MSLGLLTKVLRSCLVSELQLQAYCRLLDTLCHRFQQTEGRS